MQLQAVQCLRPLAPRLNCRRGVQPNCVSHSNQAVLRTRPCESIEIYQPRRHDASLLDCTGCRPAPHAGSPNECGFFATWIAEHSKASRIPHSQSNQKRLSLYSRTPPIFRRISISPRQHLSRRNRFAKAQPSSPRAHPGEIQSGDGDSALRHLPDTSTTAFQTLPTFRARVSRVLHTCRARNLQKDRSSQPESLHHPGLLL